MKTTYASLPDEEWRPIEGFEGWYEASSLGNIRRVRAGSGGRNGYILSPGLTSRGYHLVCLSRPDRPRKTLRLHDIIASTFIGPRPSPNHEINHIDGIKTNNAVSNLEWVTHRENIAHARAKGLRGWRSNGRPCPTCGRAFD